MKTLKLMAVVCMLGIANAADNIPERNHDVSKLTEALSYVKASDMGMSQTKLKKYNKRITREISDEKFKTEYSIDQKNTLIKMLEQIFINPKQPCQNQSKTMELYFDVLYSAINEGAKKFSAQYGEHLDREN